MYQRIINLSKSNSFFLFGPRGTGKTTLLSEWKLGLQVQMVDLLDPVVEARYSKDPSLLLEDWKSKPSEWIIVDEVQKNPILLDVIQTGITRHKIKFALTGSSARKLKRGSANLLGGRAFEFHLHPISFFENPNQDLLSYLKWGSLPEIFSFNELDKQRKLYSYVSTYLREEILSEQIVRKIEPFRRFLEVAAQMNGKILNYAKIARDSNVDEKAVSRYFEILYETLVGFFLEPFHPSIRKQQSQKSKFYFFDLGITRALQNTLPMEIYPSTEVYGNLFEQFIVLECFRLNDYLEKRFRFSYWRDSLGKEVDLIIERPDKSLLLIEIKSKNQIYREDIKSLLQVSKEFYAISKSVKVMVISQQEQSSEIEEVRCLHWKQALVEIFQPGT